MENRKVLPLNQGPYDYSFKCPTKDMDGLIKFFPEPVDKTRCFICHKPKGTGLSQCDYEMKG